MLPEPAVIRGHLAEVGSPAEAYLVAWGEVCDLGPLDVEMARCKAVAVLKDVQAHRTSADLYERASWGRRGWRWQTGRALRRLAVQDLYATAERANLAAYLLLLAQDAPGYLGVEA